MRILFALLAAAEAFSIQGGPSAVRVGETGVIRRACTMIADGLVPPKPQVPPPSPPRGILLDMDGTLTNSDELHFQAYRETLVERTPDFNGGVPIARTFYNEWMSGNSNPAVVSRLFPEWEEEAQTALWKAKEEVYRRISVSMVPLPGVSELLTHCRAAGVATIVVTNAPRLDALHTLEVLGLAEAFAPTIVIGYECARAKPHPDPYLEGLRRLGLEASECLAFEDSMNGLRSAVAAGIPTVGVTTGLPEEKLRDAGACFAVEDYLDARLWRVLGARVPGSGGGAAAAAAPREAA